MGDVQSLPKALIWTQEQGVFSNFALQDVVESNMKAADTRSGLNNGATGNAPSPDRQARAYLFSDEGKERLGV